MTKLHENVKMLCRERNMSVLGLERELGFPKNTISDWRLKLPTGDRILKVAQYFDVSLDFLFGNIDDRMSHKTVANIKESSKRLFECAEKLDLDENAASFIIEMMYSLKNHY